MSTKGTEDASTPPAADSAGDQDEQSEAAAAEKQPAMTEEADKQVEKTEQVHQQSLSTEQPDNTAEDVVTDEQPQTLTEKQLAEKLKRLKNKKKAALSAVTKTRNELGKLMMRDGNLHEVKTLFEKYAEVGEVYHDSYIAVCALLTDEEIEEEERKYIERQYFITDFQTKVANWIVEAERRLSEQLEMSSIKSKSSRSSKTSKSSWSSTISKFSKSSTLSHAQEKARLAELMVERQMLDQTKRIKEIELEAQSAATKIQLEVEIAKAEARNAAYEEVEGTTTSSSIPNQEIKAVNDMPKPETKERTIHESLHPDAKSFNPKVSPNTAALPQHESFFQPGIPSTTSASTDLLVETYRQMFLPSPEVPKFTGDPIEYKSFIMSFEARILPHVSSECNKLYYLDQQLKGEPKDLIEGCLFMAPEIGYIEATRLLDKEYGDPFKVATAYLDKLSGWPMIKHDEGSKLKQLSLFLTKCKYAMQNVSHMTVLNHTPNMKMIIGKLPGYLQNKW